MDGTNESLQMAVPFWMILYPYHGKPPIPLLSVYVNTCTRIPKYNKCHKA